MRKALFVFSGHVYKYQNHYYSLNLTKEVYYKLYFPACELLEICLRETNIENVNGLTLADGKNIIYRNIKIGEYSADLYLFKRKYIEKYLEKLVLEVDFVIARLSLMGCIAAKYAKKHHKPYICESVGSTWNSFWNHSLYGKILAPYMELMVKRTVKKSDYTIYVTQTYLQKKYPTRGKSIGISDVELKNSDNTILAKRMKRIKSLNLLNLKIATIGAVNLKIKGQKYVIKTLYLLKKRGIKMEYFLVGDGETTYLQNLAKRYNVLDQIKFVGSLSHNNIFDFLDAMDIYIQPSLHEGLPRALVEAMSRGLTCIGTNVAGIPELLDKSMLFERKSVNKLAKILSNITLETLIYQAKRNFKESQKYEEKVLKKRRDDFFELFLRENGLEY